MKNILIILAFLPLFGFGQLSPDSAWHSGYVVDGVDTFLQNNSTGTAIYQLKITDIGGQESNINAGYFAGDIKVNGQSWKTIFPDANYADTTFTLFEEHTLNTDLTEILPYRITKIYIYNSPATGAELTAALDSFNVPLYNSGALGVGVGKTYTEIIPAVTASIDDDTLYLYDGVYPESVTISGKDLTVICVGNVIINPAVSRAIIYNGTNVYERLIGVTLDAQTNLNIRDFSVTPNLLLEKCYFANAHSIYKTGSGKITMNKCVNDGNLSTIDSLLINESRFLNYTGAHIELQATNDYLKMTYNHFEEASGTGAMQFNDDCNVIDNYNTWSSNMILDAVASYDIAYNATGTIYNSDGITMSLLTLDSIAFNFTNCEFNYLGTSPVTTLRFEDQQNISFVDCNMNDINNTFINLTGDDTDTLYFSNNTLISDSAIIIKVVDSKVIMSDNYLNSKEYSNTTISADVVDNIPAEIHYNTFISQGQVDETGAFVAIGDATNPNSDGKLNGTTIIGNICYGPIIYGNPSTAAHGLFVYAQNSILKYNNVQGRYLAYVIKHKGLPYSCLLQGNIGYRNISDFVIKGSSHVKMYNNTIYKDTNSLATNCINLLADELFAGSYSDSCEIINNIFYTNSNNASMANVNFLEVLDTVEAVMNYNINYTTGTASNYRIINDLYDFSEGQGFGWDLNSFDTDPSLNANLIPSLSSDAIDNGYTLGSPYNYGLDISSTWPDGIVLKERLPGLYDIGAYEQNKTRGAVLNSQLWIYQGKPVILK